MTVGRDNDQNVANQYLIFLQNRGFKIEEHNATIVVVPESEHPITIFDNPAFVNLEISPSAYRPD